MADLLAGSALGPVAPRRPVRAAAQHAIGWGSSSAGSHRFGAPAVAISRFFPGIRALVMPAAGLARFSAWKVLWWAGLSVVVWNTLVVGLGVLAGTHLGWAKQVLVGYNTVALRHRGAPGSSPPAFVLVYRARARRSTSS